MKTVRFAQVVARSGHPHAHSLWVDPKHDPELQRAEKEHRVMTVAAAGHGKADHGTVGFDPKAPGAELLIFPKSLKPFGEARIVGIKFDLLDEPAALQPAKREKTKPSRRHLRSATNGRATTADSAAASPPESREPATDPVGRHRAPPTKSKITAAAPRRETRPAKSPVRTSKRGAPRDLESEVRQALNELRRGETVAAYERLRHAVGDA
jgi:hypothetical protein